ncbi:ABC transporter substrate-binding protein [Paenibacillus alba]|uniref:Extracellular solute-binding protein n=1 Tax=Paenibacillus alba TaxID=1197127 RepID=A0ABU6G191_9BACL|nr:extracellular solute-binding protein [Paenibacillus alba]MEC0227745.1 extracellular solute-binding protein [Paenibacillus alba]NQX69924.1 extracellular solute-binding protein [Paenibacillus alba]
MKKTIYSTLSLTVAFSLMLSGCAKSDSQTSPSPAAANTTNSAVSKKAVKLKMWGGIPEESGPKDVVTKWNSSHPDIQVEYTRYVNDDSGNTKLDTALISNSDAPDIFFSYGETNYNRRANAGVTFPLDDLISKYKFNVDEIIGKDNVIPFKGKTHYLPAMKLLSSVMINQTALEKAGEKIPAQGWTWDDYMTLAEKLQTADQKGSFIKVPDDNMVRFAILENKPVDSYYTADGLSTFDSPAVKKGLEYQKSLQDKGLSVKWPEIIANKLLPPNELLTGKAAMIFGGTHLLRNVKDTKSFPHEFKTIFAPVPQLEKGGKVNTAGFNDFMSINNTSSNKDEAFQFISWYLTEGNLLMIPGGRLPSSKKIDVDKVAELMVGDAANLINVDSLKSLIKGDYTFPVQTISTALPEMTKIINEETEKYVMGVQPLDKAIQNMKTRADQAIKAEKK